MEEKVSIWKANLSNGVIFGLIGAVWTLVMYFLDMYFNKIQGLVLIPILLVILFLMIKSYRDNYLHGFMTYGQSLGAGVIIFLYASIIGAILTYVLYKFIDPELVIKQLALFEESLEKRGTSPGDIKTIMDFQRKITVPEIMAPLSILGQMFIGTIISLIISIFTQKEGNPLIDNVSN